MEFQPEMRPWEEAPIIVDVQKKQRDMLISKENLYDKSAVIAYRIRCYNHSMMIKRQCFYGRTRTYLGREKRIKVYNSKGSYIVIS